MAKKKLVVKRKKASKKADTQTGPKPEPKVEEVKVEPSQTVDHVALIAARARRIEELYARDKELLPTEEAAIVNSINDFLERVRPHLALIAKNTVPNRDHVLVVNLKPETPGHESHRRPCLWIDGRCDLLIDMETLEFVDPNGITKTVEKFVIERMKSLELFTLGGFMEEFSNSIINVHGRLADRVGLREDNIDFAAGLALKNGRN